MSPPMPALETLVTHPMVVAVEWEEADRWWPGRVATWWRTPDGWWAFVVAERTAYLAGHPGGWMLASLVRPAHHDLEGNVSSRSRWWDWSPPDWPADLERFGKAAWNERDHDAGIRAMPAGWKPYEPPARPGQASTTTRH